MAVCLEYQNVVSAIREDRLPLKVQVAVIGILALAVASRIWVQHECTDRGYKLAEEKEYTVTLDMRRRELELERSVLVRRDSIESVARARLNLSNPHPQQIIQLD